MISRFELSVARRYLWAQRKNLSSGLIALLSMMGVAVGTWLLIFVLSASNGFEQEVKNQLMGKDAHFEVTQYYYEPVEGADSLLARVRHHPEVTAASPYVMSQAVFANKKRFSGGIVFGIDPRQSTDVIDLKAHLKWGEYRFDSLPDSNGKLRNGVIMGYALANRLGLLVGDRCILYILGGGEDLSAGVMPRVKVFVLAGTFESGMYQFDESLAYVSLDAARDAFDMGDAITGIHGRVRHPLQSGRVADEIEAELGYPYTALDWQEKNSTLIKWMDYEKVLIGLALGIIIIIAAFNIISSLIMNVNDKRREIGILRAMGATRKNILAIFIFEGLFIGVFGSFTGLALGLASCYIQMRFGLITLPGDVYFVTVLPVVPRAADIIAVMLVTNALCTLAGIIPALKASMQHPVNAIRYE